MIERKGQEGVPYSSNSNNGNGGSGNRGRFSHRTTLSAYEVMAAKVGRFDRSLEALHIDAKGQVTNKTTSIKELLLSTDMHVRDLMALSPDSLHKRGGRLTPCILPRGDVIIFVMHPLRLVIGKDSCLAFDPGDPTVQSVISDIASAIKIQQLEQAHAAASEAGNHTVTGGAWEVSYELIVLEQALRSFSNQFARIAELLSLIVETSLTALVDAGQGNEEQLFKLVPLKDGLAVAHANMQEVVDVMVELLDSDEDMLGLMLTEKSHVKGGEVYWMIEMTRLTAHANNGPTPPHNTHHPPRRHHLPGPRPALRGGAPPRELPPAAGANRRADQHPPAAGTYVRTCVGHCRLNAFSFI